MPAPISSPESRPGKLLSLEVGRGLAAMAVVFHHAAIASDAFTSAKFQVWFEWGALGVDFFFVLSGFIIYFAHHNDPPGFKSAAAFLGKRLRRIYIPYLPIGIGMALAYTYFPGISRGVHEWGWFSTLTLLPFGESPALSVAWTLVFEMIFYIAFLLFFFINRFTMVMVCWGIAVIAVNGLGLLGAETAEPLKHLFSYLILEFLAGMIVAHLFVKRQIPDWRLVLIASIILVTCYIAIPDVHRVVFGLALAPLVLLLAEWDRKKGWQYPKFMVLLGAASYAIYLIHNPVISLAARLFGSIDSWSVMFVALIVVSTGAGLAFNLFFEKPALKLASRGRMGPRLARDGVV
jgi:exopolysaccharide production protein ExoZ